MSPVKKPSKQVIRVTPAAKEEKVKVTEVKNASKYKNPAQLIIVSSIQSHAVYALPFPRQSLPQRTSDQSRSEGNATNDSHTEESLCSHQPSILAPVTPPQAEYTYL